MIKAYMHNPGNFGPEEIKGIWPSIPNKHFEWSTDPQDIAVWVDTGGGANQYDDFLRQYKKIGSKYNIMVLVEPIKLCPKNYTFVREHEDKFDIIFSTYQDYGNSDKYKYYKGGLRSFIQPNEFSVHLKTKNVCCVMSERMGVMPGYDVRHEIRNWVKHYCPEKVDYNNPPKQEKHIGTKDYRYELVIKNEDDQFFSEKILDAMLVGCIPIYWTSSTDYLSDIFNMDGIFTFQKASQFYAGLEKNMFTKELYNNNIEAIKYNFEQAKKFISFGDVLWDRGLENFVKERGLV